uniref:Homing endonuclease LAGLIDADG domain-containing protein n=1 Tax=Morchella brunnea TaxID=1174671 RepID=A0A8K1I5L6_9PEZI|nr:hypothetical protein LK370_mgp176 [Morchella brunnea]UBU98510.1 hypothetical protein [Morchella brunnea]
MINGKILMSLTELEILIEKYKDEAKESYHNQEFSSDFLLAMRYLFNGFFQAEGSWSGKFHSSSSHHFSPIFSIGQNISDKSLQFFSLLWVILGCQLKWSISKNQSGKYHIQLRSTNKEYIMSVLFPYLSLTYGEKFTAMAKLSRIDELNCLNTLSSRLEIINLAYSLTPGGGGVETVLLH